MKLSIIIPAYKVERYIRKTLLSIFTQDCNLTQLEIIVVNDGSPDDTVRVVETLVLEGYPIKLLNQENQGLSMARNNGLNYSSGEYVWFVDSDDWIAPNCIKKILSKLDCNIDILNFGAYRIADDEKTIVGKNSYTRGNSITLSGYEAWLRGVIHISTAQLSIYKREFLQTYNLRFVKGIYHEDYDFCLRASFLSRKTSIVNEIYYYQRVNPESITHSVNPKRSYDYILVAESLLRFVNEQKLTGSIEKKFHYYIAMALNNAFDNINKCNDGEILKFNKVLKGKRGLLRLFVHCGYIPYLIEGVFFAILNCRFSRIYKILKG